MEVFESLKIWFEIDLEERKGHLPELLEHVRMAMFSKCNLNSSVLPYLEKILQCHEYLFKVMRYHLLDSEQKKSHDFSNLLARKGQLKVLLVIDEGFCLGYDFKEKKVFKHMQLPKQDAVQVIVYNSQDLFCISNADSQIVIVWKWYLSKKTWIELSNCIIDTNFSDHLYIDANFEIIGSKIYTIGVTRPGETHKVLMIDTKQTELGWTTLASMSPSNRDGTYPYMLDHGGILYVFDLDAKCYEFYDEELNKWTFVKPENWPNSLDFAATLVSHDDLIYAACMDFDDPTQKEFYSFDPATITWKRLANYLAQTSEHFLLSIGNSLIRMIALNDSMEIYDVEEDKTWKKIETGHQTSGYSPCIVNKSILGKGQECG